jgi:hypothetical protein
VKSKPPYQEPEQRELDRAYLLGDYKQRLNRIAEIIEFVDHRCQAVDGPVTKTRHEITDDELREIYKLAGGK